MRARLAALEAADPALARLVRELLAADSAAGAFLEAGAAEYAPRLSALASRSGPGVRQRARPGDRPLRPRLPPRARRHGRGLGRRAARRPVRAARRPEAAAQGNRLRGHPEALRAGAAGPRASRPSQHRAAARRRNRGRAPVLRAGAGRGRADHGVRPRAPSPARGAPAPGRDLLRRGRRRAPAPRRPPRHQAFQRARHEGRPGQAARLRDRQGPLGRGGRRATSRRSRSAC